MTNAANATNADATAFDQSYITAFDQEEMYMLKDWLDHDFTIDASQMSDDVQWSYLQCLTQPQRELSQSVAGDVGLSMDAMIAQSSLLNTMSFEAIPDDWLVDMTESDWDDVDGIIQDMLFV
jgi:hypothetical protein